MEKIAIAVTERAESMSTDVIAGMPCIPDASRPQALSISRNNRKFNGAPVGRPIAPGYSDAISEGATEMVNQLSRKFGEGFMYELEKASQEDKEAVFGWLMGALGKKVPAMAPKVTKPALQQGIEKLKIRTQHMKPQPLSAPTTPLEGRGPVPETDIWGGSHSEGRLMARLNAKQNKPRTLGTEGKPEIKPL
jgi:hypothetical protein